MVKQQRERLEFERVSHRDLSLVLCHPLYLDQFDKHIANYYQRVQLNKRRLFEELGGLLVEYEFVSLHLRVAQPSFKGATKRNSKGPATKGEDSRKLI